MHASALLGVDRLQTVESVSRVVQYKRGTSNHVTDPMRGQTHRAMAVQIPTPYPVAALCLLRTKSAHRRFRTLTPLKTLLRADGGKTLNGLRLLSYVNEQTLLSQV